MTVEDYLITNPPAPIKVIPERISKTVISNQKGNFDFIVFAPVFAET